jgi:hypothetical protein
MGGIHMELSDWLQAASLIGVVVALMLSIRQLREMSVQTRSMTRTLEQTVYQQQLRAHADYRSLFFKDDPQLLAWHLRTRGYPVRDPEGNRRTLYVLIKLDEHEENYLSYSGGFLPGDVWTAWLEVLKADFRVRDFKEVWVNGKRFYATSFVDFIDNSIL